MHGRLLHPSFLLTSFHATVSQKVPARRPSSEPSTRRRPAKTNVAGRSASPDSSLAASHALHHPSPERLRQTHRLRSPPLSSATQRAYLLQSHAPEPPPSFRFVATIQWPQHN